MSSRLCNGTLRPASGVGSTSYASRRFAVWLIGCRVRISIKAKLSNAAVRFPVEVMTVVVSKKRLAWWIARRFQDLLACSCKNPTSPKPIRFLLGLVVDDASLFVQAQQRDSLFVNDPRDPSAR